MMKDNQVKTVKLETLDNPGWDLTLELESVLTEPVLEKCIVDESDWFIKHIQSQTVSFSSDSTKLIDCLSECLKFLNLSDTLLNENRQLILFLQDWYISQCDGDWEHLYGISITLDNSGFFEYTIDLADTKDNLDSRNFDLIGGENNFQCWKNGGKFLGRGKINFLSKSLDRFKEWVENGQ